MAKKRADNGASRAADLEAAGPELRQSGILSLANAGASVRFPVPSGATSLTILPEASGFGQPPAQVEVMGAGASDGRGAIITDSRPWRVFTLETGAAAVELIVRESGGEGADAGARIGVVFL